MRRVLASLKPDIVHGQGTERDCALSAAHCKYPNLITVHGNVRRIAEVSGAVSWSYLGITAKLEVICDKKTSGVICLSKHTERQVASLARQTWLIPSADDPAFFMVQRKIPCGSPVILCIGDVTRNNNQLFLLHAIQPLWNSTRFELRMFGKCNPTDAYAVQVIDFAR